MLPSVDFPLRASNSPVSAAGGGLPQQMVATLARLGQELFQLEGKRGHSPGLNDYAFSIETLIFQNPPQMQTPYRKTRQAFLLAIGQAVDHLLPQGVQTNYPRDFLHKIVLGLGALREIGYLGGALQQLRDTYRPWSEEIIYLCEIGANFVEGNPWLAELKGVGAEKGRKGLALLQAFTHLTQMALQTDTKNDLTTALLDFDKAWWSYLYYYYDPVTGSTEKERKAEFEKRVGAYQEQQREIFNQLFQGNGFDTLEQMANPFAQVLEKMLPEIDKEGKVTRPAPPIVESMGNMIESIFKMLEQDPEFDASVNKVADYLKTIVDAPAAAAPQAAVEAKAPNSNPLANIDIESIIVQIGDITERTVDYSQYRGRLVAFIEDHFDIVFRGDGVMSLDQVHEFYITDKHDCFGHRTLYTVFADLFATPQSIIFPECVKAQQACQARESFHTCSMNNFARHIGWDLDPPVIITGVSQATIQSGNDYFHYSYRMLNSGLTQEQRVEILREILKFAINSCKNLSLENCLEALKVILHIAEVRVPETFPARTEAMIEAVGAQAPAADRAIIIAGQAHLIRDTGEFKDDPRFDLDTLMAFLKPRNAIILKPKANKLEEAAAPYRAFDLRLIQIWTAALMRNMPDPVLMI